PLVTLAYVVGFLPLLMGAAMAIRDKHAIWAGKNAERTALLGLLVASAVGAAAGARFYEHYYIQLVPPFALLAAPYYAQLWAGRIQYHHSLLRPVDPYAWLALPSVAVSTWRWLRSYCRRGPHVS